MRGSSPSLRYFLASSARTKPGVKASSAPSIRSFAILPILLALNSSTQAHESTTILEAVLLRELPRLLQVAPEDGFERLLSPLLDENLYRLVHAFGVEARLQGR